MATIGSLKGEGVVFEATDSSYFMIDVPVSNPVKVKDKCGKFISNPQLETKIIQVFPVSEKTGEIVEYYSKATPKKGHKFMIADVNDALEFRAIEAYNNMAGFVNNLVKAYRFEVINLKGHNETVQEYTTRNANYISKMMGLAAATNFYMLRGNGIDANCASRYLMINSDAEKFAKDVFKKNNYTDASVSFVLAVQGIWGNAEKKIYKDGELKGYNSSYGKDLQIIIDFLVNLRNNSKGRIEWTERKCTIFAKYYHNQVRSKGIAVECDRLLKYLSNNPKKAFGTTCKACGEMKKGYIDRINEIGKSGSEETWPNLYIEISSESGF